MKKNAQLTVSQNECESIIERYEKELKFYEHNIQDYSMIKKEVRLLIKEKAEHLAETAKLNAQLKHFKDVNDEHQKKLLKSNIECTICITISEHTLVTPCGHMFCKGW